MDEPPKPAPLEYEETPVIETPLPQKHTDLLAGLGNIILVVV